jgi:hypothetical protein
MREIKVRAFDGERMIYRGLHDRNWYTEHKRGKLVKECHPRDKNMPVSEFTGLLDKNGTPIYEGDILRIIDVDFANKETASVVFEKGAFREDYYGYTINYKPYVIEVIGNKWANPELQEG